MQPLKPPKERSHNAALERIIYMVKMRLKAFMQNRGFYKLGIELLGWIIVILAVTIVFMLCIGLCSLLIKLGNFFMLEGFGGIL